MKQKSLLVCGISNMLDGSQIFLIQCAAELENILTTCGLQASHQESDSEDPFNIKANSRLILN